MKRFFSLMLVIILLAGCGAHNLKITSDPSGADVYANNSYIGRTPCDVPANWNYLWSDTVTLKIQKKGYAPYFMNITTEELRIKKKNKELTSGSKFGKGDTYPFEFKLEKE